MLERRLGRVNPAPSECDRLALGEPVSTILASARPTGSCPLARRSVRAGRALENPEQVRGLALIAPLANVLRRAPSFSRMSSLRARSAESAWTIATPAAIIRRARVIDTLFAGRGPRDFATAGAAGWPEPKSFCAASEDLVALNMSCRVGGATPNCDSPSASSTARVIASWITACTASPSRRRLTTPSLSLSRGVTCCRSPRRTWSRSSSGSWQRSRRRWESRGKRPNVSLAAE